jgi:hypothetical protein
MSPSVLNEIFSQTYSDLPSSINSASEKDRFEE